MTRRATFAVALLSACVCAQGEAPAWSDCEAWTDAIATDRSAAILQLVAGVPDSLPLLRVLLESDGDAAEVAAIVAEKVGRAAASLEPALLQRLRTAESWWTQVRCADALAAIGAGGPEVLDALLQHCIESDVPRLRSCCARAAQRLGAAVGERVLAAVAAGRYEDPARAIETLRWLGEGVADQLVAGLHGNGEAGRVARDALSCIGWRAVDRLERAGHRELAQRALRTGPLQDVMGVEEYELAETEPQPPVQQLPEITWESGSGHGGGLKLARAAEVAAGMRFDVIAATTSYDGDRLVANVTVTSAEVPRVSALAAMRQLAMLAQMRLVRVRGDATGAGWSSADFHSRVLATVRGDVMLDATFTGYPSSGTVVERFAAEAARNVLNQLLADAEWTERAPTDEDRAIVAARCERVDGDEKWVRSRLLAMRDALRVK